MVDPTDGFTPVPLHQSNFEVQKPYDVPQNQRYSHINGVHKLWVYSTDKAHTTTSHTASRTEIRIRDMDTCQADHWCVHHAGVRSHQSSHNLNDAGMVKIYIDGDLKYEGPDDGGKSHYFKFGVYEQNDSSNYMESRWKEIKVFKK
ncbi:Citrate-binding protein [Vitis vinifera]|uniref:Citrate-binding protein n=1 Tax=Vitis vinifera TaxID=29760 RepID=A0A438F5I9_VITVI|nr:Citrate-binding protein [Vitis vinifera]